MRIAQPLELDTPHYSLRLEGSILTVTPLIASSEYQGPTTRTRGIDSQKMACHAPFKEGDEPNPYAIIADLMREMARVA